MVQTNCAYCGNTFQVRPYKIIAGTKLFCSHHCACKDRTVAREIPCPICGDTFIVRPSQIRNGGGKFCSRKCALVNWSRTPLPVAFRFWRRVEITEGCWLWKGWCGGKSGHGTFIVDKARGISTTAHRFAWTLLRGDVPEGIFVCHDCPGGDVPRCVRPDHMFLGTQGDNLRDAGRKGRMSHFGESNNKAKLTDEQVIEIRRLYAEGRSTQEALAARFGVCQGTIGKIVHGIHWPHLL